MATTTATLTCSISGFGVNITAPGDYRLEGVLADCSGDRIELLTRARAWRRERNIEVNVSGSRYLEEGQVRPDAGENLILRDKNGNYHRQVRGEHNHRSGPQRVPGACRISDRICQPDHDSNLIAVGVNISVIKPGSYMLRGTIVDDAGEALGTETVKSNLVPGNTTIVLQFDPDQFMSWMRSLGCISSTWS